MICPVCNRTISSGEFCDDPQCPNPAATAGAKTKPAPQDGDGLLPCPFCGSAATARMYSDDMLFKVECNGCGAEMRGFDQCQQDAVDAWNTRALTAALSDQVVVPRPRAFLDWAADIFGPLALERRERLTRFVEEALELASAERMPISLLERLIDRVWASPQGETSKELGQAQACLETFAESIGLSADKESAREFDRVRSIPKEEWTRRHRVKVAHGIADIAAAPASTAGEVGK